jgi:hypothetical protein
MSTGACVVAVRTWPAHAPSHEVLQGSSHGLATALCSVSKLTAARVSKEVHWCGCHSAHQGGWRHDRGS